MNSAEQLSNVVGFPSWNQFNTQAEDENIFKYES